MEFSQTIEASLQQEREHRERFYVSMSDEYKMEFINGRVIVHPSERNWHLVARKNLTVLLDIFARTRRAGIVREVKCLCVFPRNDYEPDIVFFGPEKAATIKPDTLKFPIPDLAVEILSDSTEERDRGVKFADFEAHGVREYWIIDPENQTLEQYLLRDGAYQLHMKSSTGEVRSEVVPGFSIPVTAIFDDAENQAALRSLL
jgi:Uma2 family endonuclease